MTHFEEDVADPLPTAHRTGRRGGRLVVAQGIELGPEDIDHGHRVTGRP